MFTLDEADREIITSRLGAATARPDAAVSLIEMSRLLEVERETPHQWRARTNRGELARPMPEPDHPASKPDKPLWRLRTILPWLIDTDRWPPGRIARPDRRGPRAGQPAAPGVPAAVFRDGTSGA